MLHLFAKYSKNWNGCSWGICKVQATEGVENETWTGFSMCPYPYTSPPPPSPPAIILHNSKRKCFNIFHRSGGNFARFW